MARKWKNTFKVGSYKCEMTYRERGGLSAVWSPDVPDFENLAPAELRQYRTGRDQLFAEVGKALGGPVVILEA